MISKILFFSLIFPLSAQALTIVTTLPELAEIAREIAPDAQVESLLNGSEDPHFVDARPAFVLKVSKADLVIAAGFDLEVGWLPKVLTKAGIARLQPGGAGSCEAGTGVSALDKPVGPVDRSMGDVHPHGNPHYTLSPVHLIQASKAVRDCLVKIDPSLKAVFDKGQARFAGRMERLKNEIATILQPVIADPARNRFEEYHRELAYFAEDFGLDVLGSVEEKPGLPPSTARLARVSEELKSRKVRLVIASIHHPVATLKRLEEMSGVPFRQVPLFSTRERGLEPTLKQLAQALVEGSAR